jgi:hypothetical protein
LVSPAHHRGRKNACTRDVYSANNGLAGALAGAANGSFDRSGWLAGAGIEWAFLPNWSVKAKYNYIGFDQVTEYPTTTGNLAASPAVVKLNLQTAILGINYRFRRYEARAVTIQIDAGSGSECPRSKLKQRLYVVVPRQP